MTAPRTRRATAIAGAALLVAAAVLIPDLRRTIGTLGSAAFARFQSSGVIVGDDAFVQVTVTDHAGWRLAGEFDGEAGDELALVEDGALRLLTPATLTERRRLPLDVGVAAHWTGATRLIRDDGRLLVVDAGAGIADSRVRDLNGHELWRYRPSPDLPPRSFTAADLDRDGRAEFYATTDGALVRLDDEGHEVWQTPLSEGSVTATAGRTSHAPPWVVATTRDRAVVSDDRGSRLGSVGVDRPPLGIVDWAGHRRLLLGGNRLRAVGLDGAVDFEWTVAGATVTAAVPVSLAPGAPPGIALVAETGDRRWHVQIVERDGGLLYDEILGALPHLIAARGADGVDRLFVSSASEVVALRPIAP